jgi:hypothetical protein
MASDPSFWSGVGRNFLGDLSNAGADLLRRTADRASSVNNAAVVPSEQAKQPWMMYGLAAVGVVVVFLLVRRR